MSKEIILEKNFKQCRTIFLNRPERFNALSLELAEALAFACQRAAQDDGVRVLILRGAKGNFSAGGDLKHFYQNLPVADQAFFKVSEALNQAIESITSMAKPVIAAIEGHAYAAGFGLVLACDLLVASQSARLSPSFTNIALAPNASSTYFLPRILGPKRAAEAFFRAQVFSAQEAKQVGILNHVWPEEEFESQLESLLDSLLARPLGAMGSIKRILKMSDANSLSEQLKLEKESISASARSQDFKEGVSAFVQKRVPKFND